MYVYVHVQVPSHDGYIHTHIQTDRETENGVPAGAVERELEMSNSVHVATHFFSHGRCQRMRHPSSWREEKSAYVILDQPYLLSCLDSSTDAVFAVLYVPTAHRVILRDFS